MEEFRIANFGFWICQSLTRNGLNGEPGKILLPGLEIWDLRSQMRTLPLPSSPLSQFHRFFLLDFPPRSMPNSAGIPSAEATTKQDPI
jgi:hypothetical protein